MREDSVDIREDHEEPANGGTRGGHQPDDDSESGARDEYPANGGTRGTAPVSTTAAQQHPSASTDTT